MKGDYDEMPKTHLEVHGWERKHQVKFRIYKCQVMDTGEEGAGNPLKSPWLLHSKIILIIEETWSCKGHYAGK